MHCPVARSPDIISRIEATGIFKDSPHRRPNHVILNEVRSSYPGLARTLTATSKKYHPCMISVPTRSRDNGLYLRILRLAMGSTAHSRPYLATRRRPILPPRRCHTLPRLTRSLSLLPLSIFTASG